MLQRMLRIAALAMLVGGATAMTSEAASADSKSSAKAPTIVMYATPTCGYCAKARQYFSARGLHWDERDIEASAQAKSEWKTLGGMGTPLILVDDEKISGFHQARIDAALAKYTKK